MFSFFLASTWCVLVAGPEERNWGENVERAELAFFRKAIGSGRGNTHPR